MKGLIIYDFDGVLVNSRSAVLLYYDAVFSHFNLPQANWTDACMTAKAFGMSHRQLMSEYADGDVLEEMCSYVPPFSMEQMLDVTPLESEVAEVIPELAKNYYLAICTNRGASLTDYLKHYSLDTYFSYIVTSMDVKEAKPSPEGVFKILDNFKMKDALYVGDSDVDYLAAKAAGIRFLAYKTQLFDSSVIMSHKDIYIYL